MQRFQDSKAPKIRKKISESDKALFMKYFGISAMIAAAVLFAALAGIAQETTTVEVCGDVLNPGQWSVENLKQQFSKDVQTIKFSLAKEAHIFLLLNRSTLQFNLWPVTSLCYKRNHYNFVSSCILREGAVLYEESGHRGD